jgi:hypothetical protein
MKSLKSYFSALTLAIAAIALGPLGAPCAHAQTLIKCSSSVNCVFGTGPYNTATGNQAGDAFGIVNANFSALAPEFFTTKITTVPHGGTGVATLTGLIKGNGASAFTAAAAPDIYGLFGCAGVATTFLNGNGGCTSPTGSGTVNSGTSGQVAYYSATGTAVSGATLAGNLAIVSGVLGTTQAINAQTGTSYALLTTDAGKLVTLSNASAVAVSLSAATTTGFTAGYSFDVQNLGAGTATITPATSTINGASTLTLATNTGCTVTSDGTNYQVSACTAVASGGGGAGSFTTLGSTGVATLASALTQAANTSVSGLILADSTAATSGNQQFSPHIRLTGQGWKTTATAASQETDWIVENQPVQGSTAPTSNLVMSSQIAGGGYNAELTLTSGGNLSTNGSITANNGGVQGQFVDVNTSTISGVGMNRPGTNILGLFTNSTLWAELSATGHWISLGTAPAATSCGTTPAMSAQATDYKGTVTEGTTATGCILTFATAYATAPDCIVTSPTGSVLTSYSVSTTALTLVNSSASGDKFSYVCIQ